MHEPVLLKETIASLVTSRRGVYIDCTVGGGGHLRALARELDKEAVVIGIDRDGEVLAQTANALADLPVRLHLVNEDYRHIGSVVNTLGFPAVDGVMMDLGVSSFQLDEEERGFSYQHDARLDMRMDRRQAVSAYEIVNQWDEGSLRQILWEYGEERYGGRIAAAIVRARAQRPVTTSGELVSIIKEAVPAAYRREKHPARRTFQALRLAVNQELEALEEALPQAFALLKPGGRLAVITFHSLEDRLVKQFMQERATGCICPPRQPVCTCHRQPEGNIITRKPVLPTAEELDKNPRSRSAKLRVIERLSSNQNGGRIT